MSIQVAKIISGIANSKLMKNNLNKSILDPQFAARVLLVTSVSKDVFSYVLRVKNAKKNKEIPEDKKPFVVAMDKATGITTTAVQLCTGFLISSNKFQNYCSSKLFTDLAKKPELMNVAKASFSSISTLIGSTLLAKRLLVPLIATPLASYFVKKQAKNDDELRRGQKYINDKFYNDKMTDMHFTFTSKIKV